MTNPLQLASLPEVTLDSGCTVTFEALDATTGATVTGVVVSNAALYGINNIDDASIAIPDGAGPTPLYVVEDEPVASG